MCLNCTPTHSTWPVVCCLPCVSFYCSSLMNAKMYLTPCDLFAMQHGLPVLALLRLLFRGLQRSGRVLLVLPMNSVKQLFYFLVVFFFSFPRILTQSLREIEGSENNLKPYNLLYLKVPLFSERNSLSLESVYEPLYCFSQDTLCGSGRDTPYGYILPALRIAGHI